MKLPIATALMTFFSLLVVAGSRVAISLSALAQRDSAFLVGALMAAYSLIPMLAGVPAGRLIDRLGLRVPLIGGMAGIAAGVAVPAVSDGIPALFAAALLVGTASIVFSIAVSNAIGMLSPPEHRTRNFAWYTISLSASMAAGPLAAGFVIESGGYRIAFLVLTAIALAGVAAGIGFRGLLVAPAAKAAPRSGGMLELVNDPRLRAIFAVTALLNLIWDLYQFIVPLYGTRIGLSPSQIGTVVSAFSIATFCIRLVMPLLVRRFREWTLVAATLAAAGIGFACLPAADGFASLAAVGVVLGAGFGFALPVLLSLSYAASPRGREGEVAGARFMLSSAAHFAFPLALGALIGTLGLGPMVWVASGLLFGGTWYAARQRRASRFANAAAESRENAPGGT